MDQDGEFAITYAAERRIVQNHFRILLNGITSSLAAILCSEREQMVQVAVNKSTIVRRIEAIPSKQFVVRRHAAAKERASAKPRLHQTFTRHGQSR